MQPDTVSIIIPVYNVQWYLDKCVESVLQQDYPALEVLLVDDGSTDSSGQLCDEWEKKDSRIRVIHKENGGLSDARNAGLDAASGDYIAFVDSDDYIAKDMIRKLYDALAENNADLSICNFLYVDENGKFLSGRNKTLPIENETLSGLEAIRKMSAAGKKGWYYITAWNKLYRRSLFSTIRFPKGKIHEDEFIAHRVFALCETVACIRDAGYYYVQRTGSIMRTRNMKSNLHAAEALLDRARFCDEHELNFCAGRAYLKAAMYLSDASSQNKKFPELREEFRETFRCFRVNRRLRKYCSAKEGLQVLLVLQSPAFYHLIFRNPLRQRIKTDVDQLAGRS